jgi:hypothetical protein
MTANYGMMMNRNGGVKPPAAFFTGMLWAKKASLRALGIEAEFRALP